MIAARIARQDEDRVALMAGNVIMTFAELNRRSSQLASHLAIRPGDGVGIFMERSMAAVVATLAVLKAGGVFVPLEPQQPAARLAMMVEDSKARLVISEPWLAPYRTWLSLPVVCLEDVADATPCHPAFESEGAAYIIFTSGSTGRPKGVVGTHQSIVNRTEWMERKFPWQADDVVVHKTALGFVDSVWEMLGPLAAGIPLVISSQSDPGSVAALVRQTRATRLVLVPSLLAALLDEPGLDSLRMIISSGERLPAATAVRCKQVLPQTLLVNIYGSTEVGADATYYVCGQERNTDCPIGKPIDNVSTHLMDGELCIGGRGLALGYCADEELTREKFVMVPDRGRMFRTGDRAEWGPDGNLGYLGRLDGQLKVRGFRIEPGDVEAALRKIEGVREVAVVLRGGALAAFVEMAPGAELSSAAARRNLPAFMQPSWLIAMDRLPRTPSGKVDRSALPEPGPERPATLNPFVPPSTALTWLIASIWSSVLNVEPIGITDSFFDLGGHSLLATRTVARLELVLGVQIPLRPVFETPTIEGLVAALTAGGTSLWDLEVRAKDVLVKLS